MSLANPMYLWALLGLTVPVAIHLLSRKEGRVIKLGSIRHVHETSTQQFQGIRLNEILLLVLRCALLVILVLGICGFYFDQKNKKWILIEPGVEKNKLVRAALDTLEGQDYESRWLAPAFPPATQVVDSTFFNFWLALKKLKLESLKEAIIFSHTKIEWFAGIQQPTPNHIKIITVEPEEKKFILEAISADDSVLVRTGFSNSAITSFHNQTLKSISDTIPTAPVKIIKVLLVHDNKHEQEMLLVESALRAIDRITPHHIQISRQHLNQYKNSTDLDWLIWLTDEPSPYTQANLLKWHPLITSHLITQSEKKQWLLTQSFDKEMSIDKKITLSLAKLLLTDPELELITKKNDRRVIPETLIWTSESESEKFKVTSSSFSTPLFGLFFLLMLLERFISYRKNQ